MKEYRVELVPLEASHENFIVRWRNDPTLSGYMFNSAPVTLESHRLWFQRYQNSTDRQEFVIVVSDQRVPIGTIGLSAIDRNNRKAEYGILIGEADYAGKGYAKEASQLLLKYGFEKIDLNKIYLRVFDDNDRAVDLYEKLGFKKDGLLRQDILKAGRFRNVLEMSILKEDWKDV